MRVLLKGADVPSTYTRRGSTKEMLKIFTKTFDLEPMSWINFRAA